MQPRVGVIGIGTMGRPIAENLLRAGFPLTTHDVRPQVLEQLPALGARAAASAAELARGSDMIVLVVPDEKAVRRVLFAKDGVVHGAAPGSVVIDMTTSDPRSTKPSADRLARKGIDYLDAPMTGGASGARAGQLLVMAGGKAEVFQRCLPIFRAISRRAMHVGDIGHGHVMKLIHNHVSHAVYAATCEAVALGETLGLSAANMIELFNEGNARSYTTEFRFPKFILSGTYDMGATYEIVCKDMSLARRLGARARLRLPMNACTYAYWKHAVVTGKGREDWATAVVLMKEMLKKKRKT
jgi:2-hydroxymethylglutarate dehydrogenase